jgi:leucyl aminopeptidase
MGFTLASSRQKGASLASRGAKIRHLLYILPAGPDWHDAPDHASVLAALVRRGKKADDLVKKAMTLELPGGCLSSWLRLDVTKSVFDWHSALRQGLKPLLDEHPAEIHIAPMGPDAFRARVGAAAAYVAWLNGAPLPSWKSDKAPAALARIVLHGVSGLDLKRQQALAEGNTLTRTLTMLPPNMLTPATYREHIRALAREAGWGI